ncbi:MAG TPA: RNA methyltransferase [Candidatus Limnocylindria bacterium]|nr:RNA methyltransferase [Candidatus Limnocylindria bacterium]
MNQKDLIAHLSQFVTDHKLHAMHRVLAERTRHITVVLEDVFQPCNASAVVRSAECFGVQEVHVIEGRNRFRVEGGVAMGAAKWLDIHRYTAMQECLDNLKKRGYLLVATVPPGQNTYALPDFPIDTKFALMFGTELTGLGESALAQADALVTIPMVGFTESFNISVSAALCLYQVTARLKRSTVAWQLSEQEKSDILLTWLRRTIRASSALEKRFISESSLPFALKVATAGSELEGSNVDVASSTSSQSSDSLQPERK